MGLKILVFPPKTLPTPVYETKAICIIKTTNNSIENLKLTISTQYLP
ncbi:hypothetical protein YPPY19_3543, partial [Yersinia pestis PY-19]